MHNRDTDIKADEQQVRNIYNYHTQNGLQFQGGLAGFQQALESHLHPVAHFLFVILPKFPALKDNYLKDLDEADILQIHALSKLYNKKPLATHQDVTSGVFLNIRLKETKAGLHKVSTFHPDVPAIHDIAEEAIEYFLKKSTLDDLRAMDEDMQTLLLECIEDMDIDLLRKPEQHQKLVYSLHIPQEIKRFHSVCVKELAARIIINEDLGDGITAFLNKDDAARLDLPYIEADEDKQYVVRCFMRTMAEIWDMPDPIEENYTQAPEPDKNGKEFLGLMHAFYRAANDNTETPAQSAGLIYGFNTHQGYITTDRRYALKAVAHEFGHLISNFIVCAHANPHIMSKQPRKDDIQNSALLSLETAKKTFSLNNLYSYNGRYYGSTTADFTGFNAAPGHHPYKGQLEERHADWLGQKAIEATEFALAMRNNMHDLRGMKDLIQQKFKDIVGCTLVSKKTADLYKSITDDIGNARNFKELEAATHCAFNVLEPRFSNTPQSEQRERLFSSIINNFVNKPKTLEAGRREYAEFRVFCEYFFDVRDIILDYEDEMRPPIENTLTGP